MIYVPLYSILFFSRISWLGTTEWEEDQHCGFQGLIMLVLQHRLVFEPRDHIIDIVALDNTLLGSTLLKKPMFSWVVISSISLLCINCWYIFCQMHHLHLEIAIKSLLLPRTWRCAQFNPVLDKNDPISPLSRFDEHHVLPKDGEIGSFLLGIWGNWLFLSSRKEKLVIFLSSTVGKMDTS